VSTLSSLTQVCYIFWALIPKSVQNRKSKFPESHFFRCNL
jgi:hypothetical protein